MIALVASERREPSVANDLLESVAEHFTELDDPRRETANRRHEFVDILTIALCAVIGGGANHWTTVVNFPEAKEEWFRRFLRLPNGIPSHETFSDVFAKIDPDTFERCFITWVAALAQSLPGAPVVAIDGKTLRRSADRANGGAPTHIVSAYANATSLVLRQIRTADKSNEITAIPTLLDMLSLEGDLVTIDAMGCQTAIVERVVARGADYLLSVKENQPSLCEAIGEAFLDVDKERVAARFGEPAEQENAGHGRVERHRCWVCDEPALIKSLSSTWKGLKSLVVIESERTAGDGETTLDRHWYISSRTGSAGFFLSARCEHWSVENGLHWVLDVAFREDECRGGEGDGYVFTVALWHRTVYRSRRTLILPASRSNRVSSRAPRPTTYPRGSQRSAGHPLGGRRDAARTE